MKKILIIDDELELVEVLGVRLSTLGYDVATAHDGEEGLKKVYSEKPDLILLDILMPKMNGYQVFLELKKKPDTTNIPVIVLTAKSHDSEQILGHDLGMENYMIKPFDIEKLMAKIKSLISL